jgi:hypothetical protein
MNLGPRPQLELRSIPADFLIVDGPSHTDVGFVDRVTGGPMENEVIRPRASIGVEYEAIGILCNPTEISDVVIEKSFHSHMMPLTIPVRPRPGAGVRASQVRRISGCLQGLAIAVAGDRRAGHRVHVGALCVQGLLA